MHIYLIGEYYRLIEQQHPGRTILQKDVILDFMTMVDPAIGWFEIFEIPLFNLDEIARGGN